MERYNKVYLAIWLFFSAITFALMMIFVFSNLATTIEVDEMIENEGLALSFLLLLFMSEIIGFMLARLTVDRIPWACQMYAIFT